MFQKEKSDIYRYNGGGGEEISSRKLVLAQWFVAHRILLRKIGIGILVSFCVVFLGFGLFGWVKYLSYDYWVDRNQLVEQTVLFQNYTNLQPIYSASNFRVSGTKVFRSAEEKYDLTAKVANPNKMWGAKITYKFLFSGGETDSRSVIVLPNTESPVIYFGLSSVVFPTNVRLVVENIEWKRVGPHISTDPIGFVSSRTDFFVENFNFTRGSLVENAVPVNRIEFDIINNSAYGFWEPLFVVELLNGDQTVGYIPLTLSQFRSGDMEHIDLRSFIQTSNVREVKLHYLLDIFEDNSYMNPGE
ncbi:MAG: hypothetical protein L3J07_03510 [Candidatus Magasanikbacteria bacterium]|nr:hypothetical protein [Candidatus Magasanikbacteria bacterium]